MNKYYIYQYLRKDGTPYYIGKGCDNRAYQDHKSHRPPKDKSRIQFLFCNLDNEVALSLEIWFIWKHGRKDIDSWGILRNIKPGGEGGGVKGCKFPNRKKPGRQTKPRSAEHSKAISESKKGKSPWNKGIKTGPNVFKGIPRNTCPTGRKPPRTQEHKDNLSKSRQKPWSQAKRDSYNKKYEKT